MGVVCNTTVIRWLQGHTIDFNGVNITYISLHWLCWKINLKQILLFQSQCIYSATPTSSEVIQCLLIQLCCDVYIPSTSLVGCKIMGIDKSAFFIGLFTIKNHQQSMMVPRDSTLWAEVHLMRDWQGISFYQFVNVLSFLKDLLVCDHMY